MSDLTALEKRKLERALGMESGYLLNFSNTSFAGLFQDTLGIDIYDEKYVLGSGSKANRMRAFWQLESNQLVAKILDLLFTEWNEFKGYGFPDEPPKECLRIVQRLKDSAPVPDIEALTITSTDQSFETLVRSVRDSIERNEPEVGLDRLHTYVVKYFRVICNKWGIDISRNKPLHALVGEYVKVLKKEGIIESDMTERILKSSISILEAFNHVRNDHSFAHDNEILNYNESLLIIAHVTSLIRFIESIESL
jgi:hypothetical protein